MSLASVSAGSSTGFPFMLLERIAPSTIGGMSVCVTPQWDSPGTPQAATMRRISATAASAGSRGASCYRSESSEAAAARISPTLRIRERAGEAGAVARSASRFAAKTWGRRIAHAAP